MGPHSSSIAANPALPSGVALAAIALVVLNLFDVFATLAHVQQGAVELNPLMQQLLARGALVFALAKHFLVAGAVVLFAACCRSRLALGALRFLALPAYSLVAIYQAALFGLVN